MPIPLDDPIVAAPSRTPFAADDSVDFQAIERNVERWLSTPLSGFMLNSENEEEAFLSEVERLESVRLVSRVSSGRKLIIANVDSPSVTETLRMAEHYVAAGAELLRVRIPRLTSNVRDCLDILRLMLAGNLVEAQSLQARLIEIDHQILSRGAAGIKAALNLLGYEMGAPRSPSPACDASAIEQIRTALMACNG